MLTGLCFTTTPSHTHTLHSTDSQSLPLARSSPLCLYAVKSPICVLFMTVIDVSSHLPCIAPLLSQGLADKCIIDGNDCTFVSDYSKIQLQSNTETLGEHESTEEELRDAVQFDSCRCSCEAVLHANFPLLTFSQSNCWVNSLNSMPRLHSAGCP